MSAPRVLHHLLELDSKPQSGRQPQSLLRSENHHLLFGHAHWHSTEIWALREMNTSTTSWFLTSMCLSFCYSTFWYILCSLKVRPLSYPAKTFGTHINKQRGDAYCMNSAEEMGKMHYKPIYQQLFCKLYYYYYYYHIYFTFYSWKILEKISKFSQKNIKQHNCFQHITGLKK